MIGQVISNYKIVSVIGEGGMGVVYMAEHIHLSRKAAIKSLHKKLITNNNLKERFKNEAATLSQIEHPNIVKLYDYVEKDDGLYLIMEYVEGVPLDEFIKKESGPIKEDNAIKIMNGMLAGFNYAHKKNIVHRDVKPSNVIISRDFSVIKILDFGIAKILGDDSRNLTKDGTQMGTIYYMSPEQVKGLKLDKRSDIYSLGVTFYQMITGTNPYEALTTEFEIYTLITQTELQDAKSVYPYISDKIDYVIKKATQKNVVDRYQSCNDIINDINDEHLKIPELISTVPSELYPIDDIELNEKTGNKKGIIIALSSVLVIAVAMVIYYWGGLKEYLKWKDAIVFYSYANSLSMRRDTTTFSDNNKLPVNLKYGDSIKILPSENLAPWGEGKFNEFEGLVNTNYLISHNDFRLLSRILVNKSINDISLTKYRKSLLTYFKTHSITPDMPQEEQFMVFGDNAAREKFAIDNVLFWGKLSSIYVRKDPLGKKIDFCIIPIQNLTSGIKQGFLFIYENDYEVSSHLIQSMNPIYEDDFNIAFQKLQQYGLYLNRNDMAIASRYYD